ncbi:MAG TPA: pilus assembly protein TadG-related protein [Acidimicrobiales bacterium]|nr:pilus assembly protein TadG-related protein [Acidimicrobiales bacterium]
MRSLKNKRAERERGAIAIVVAALLVVLIAAAALAIDISSLYQEKRTLQNGADAAALAVAKDCALTTCNTALANTYADLNADDGNHNVDEVCGTGPGLAACADPPSVPAGTEYVKVTTSTFETISGDDQINFNFAPVLDLIAPGDHSGKTMRASAVAAWGSPGGATTLPITFSLCEYQEFVPTPDSLQTGPPFTGAASIIYFHGSTAAGSCPAGPSGFDLPGGFGWLDTDADCQAVIEVGDWVSDETGVAVPNCVDLTSLRNTTILLPIFDQTNGLTGANGEYHIVGFAAFYLTGYRFPGDRWPNNFSCPEQPGSSGTCLRGYFTGFVTTGTSFGGPDMGVNIIKLVG